MCRVLYAQQIGQKSFFGSNLMLVMGRLKNEGKKLFCFEAAAAKSWCHDIQHDDTQHNDIQHK
jgi:hypothetical protein